MTKINILKFKEWLKLNKPDYEGFIYHIQAWEKEGVPFGIKDLIRIAKAYNCPVPKVKNGEFVFDVKIKPERGLEKIEIPLTVIKTETLE